MDPVPALFPKITTRCLLKSLPAKEKQTAARNSKFQRNLVLCKFKRRLLNSKRKRRRNKPLNGFREPKGMTSMENYERKRHLLNPYTKLSMTKKRRTSSISKSKQRWTSDARLPPWPTRCTSKPTAPTPSANTPPTSS